MNLDEAKVLLSTCKRSELRDHAFGDCEVYWEKGNQTAENGTEVASGYFGADGAEVTVTKAVMVDDGAGDTVLGQIRFTGDDARALRACGSTGSIMRNDSTGPAEYREGETMPLLTRDGVLDELTAQPCRRCVECAGQDHHFSESGLTCPEDGSDPFYRCKHCSATAKICDDCDGAIWPPWSLELCRSCNNDRLDELDAEERCN